MVDGRHPVRSWPVRCRPDHVVTFGRPHADRASGGHVAEKRNRLSFRIPWLVEAVAEGPLAIAVLFVLVVFMTFAKGWGWW